MAAAEAVAFRAALGRIGFTIPAQNAISMEQGLTTIDSLALPGKNEVKHVCKIAHEEPNPIPVPFMQGQLLDVMRYWVKTRIRLGRPTTAMYFMMAAAQEYATR